MDEREDDLFEGGGLFGQDGPDLFAAAAPEPRPAPAVEPPAAERPAAAAPPPVAETVSVAASQPESPLALYRRYRPETFAQVIGQEHVTEPLQRALANNKVNHAYLFSGPRGCGKTTSARILARALNCENGPGPVPCGQCQSCRDLARGGPGSIDVIEIDAASHGGVDEARDLRERTFFAPVRSRYKIYIVDEAHMVTSAGFNALLKVVEEPPPHVKFIFATTAPDKVLATIRSRTHHYPFRLVPPKTLAAYLAEVCESEHVSVEPGVLPLVVRAGAGSVRDSLSVLDQLLGAAGADGVSYRQAAALLGFTPDALLDDTVDAFAAGDAQGVFAAVDRVIEAGLDPRRFAEDLLRRLRDLIIVGAVPDALASGLVDVAADQAERLTAQASALGPGELTRAADVIATGLVEMRGTTAPRLHLELMCARVLLPGSDAGERGVHARLDRLERRMGMTGVGGDTDTRVAPPVLRQAQEPRETKGASGSPLQGDAHGARIADVTTERGTTPTPPTLTESSTTVGGLPPREADVKTPQVEPVDTGASDEFSTPTMAAPAARFADMKAKGGDPLQPPSIDPLSTPTELAAATRAADTKVTGGYDQRDPLPTAPPRSDDATGEPGTNTPPVSTSSTSGPPPTLSPQSDDVPPPTAFADTKEPPASGLRPASPVARSLSNGSDSPGIGPLTTADVRRHWPDILEHVKGARRFTWILLSQNAHVANVNDGVLTLGLANAGARESFERGGSVDVLRDAIVAVLGSALHVQAIVDASDQPGMTTAVAPSGSVASQSNRAAAAPGSQPGSAAPGSAPGGTAPGGTAPGSAPGGTASGSGPEAAPGSGPGSAPGPAGPRSAAPQFPPDDADGAHASTGPAGPDIRALADEARRNVRPTRWADDAPPDEDEPEPDYDDPVVDDIVDAGALLVATLDAELIEEPDLDFPTNNS